MSYTPKLLVLNAIFAPVLLALIGVGYFGVLLVILVIQPLAQVSTLIGGSIVPLFGLPVFLLAGPKPKRFWSELGNSVDAPSAIYYARAAPVLKAMLQQVGCDDDHNYGEVVILSLLSLLGIPTRTAGELASRGYVAVSV
jgi:hypothetical protein